MTQTKLSQAIALRIGLAARALPDTQPARLIEILAETIGLPPTDDKLSHLKIKDLKQAARGELAEVDTPSLKHALALLKGEVNLDVTPPPDIEPYREGDLPDSIRVACASNSGELLDGHFGSCRRFLIYQVAAAGCRLIACREVDDSEVTGEKNHYRAQLISDCHLLYVVSIGGPAAAKVVRSGVHPVKFPAGGTAREHIANLQEILAERVSPWLAKAMGQPEAEHVTMTMASEAVS